MEDFVEPWTRLGQKFKQTRNSQFTQLIPSKKDTTIHHGRPGESLLLPRVGKPSKTSPPLPPVILVGQNNSIFFFLNQTLRLSVANEHDLYWESYIPWMNRTSIAAVGIDVARTPPAIPSPPKSQLNQALRYCHVRYNTDKIEKYISRQSKGHRIPPPHTITCHCNVPTREVE